VADDFQMKMLSLMSAYNLKQDQRENSFYFTEIPEEDIDGLYREIQEVRSFYNRKVTITRYQNTIIVDDGGSR
jgi:hypothetical protein